MELETTEIKESLYADLPSIVQPNSSKLGIEKLGEDFLKTFIKKTIHTDSTKEKKYPMEFLMVTTEMLDNPNKKSKQCVNYRKKSGLTKSEQKKLKLFDIKKDNQRYETYKPLHLLWKKYIDDLLSGHSTSKSDACLSNDLQKLMKADLHGAILTVKKSKCPSYVHTSGIVLQETRNTFKMITEENKVKCIPKVNSVFAIEHSGVEYTIYGNHFRVKSSERAVRKFKHKATIDL